MKLVELLKAYESAKQSTILELDEGITWVGMRIYLQGKIIPNELQKRIKEVLTTHKEAIINDVEQIRKQYLKELKKKIKQKTEEFLEGE